MSGRLEFQSDGAAEKGRDGEHGAAGGNKGRHKCWGADLFIGEVDGGAQITKLEVFNKFVFSRKSARRAAEFAGIVPVEKFANRTPFLRASDDSVADFDQRLRFRVPQSGRSETAAGLKVKIEAGRVNVFFFAAMGESHGDVGFVRPLVVGEPRVAVDAKHRAA